MVKMCGGGGTSNRGRSLHVLAILDPADASPRSLLPEVERTEGRLADPDALRLSVPKSFGTFEARRP